MEINKEDFMELNRMLGRIAVSLETLAYLSKLKSRIPESDRI